MKSGGILTASLVLANILLDVCTVDANDGGWKPFTKQHEAKRPSWNQIRKPNQDKSVSEKTPIRRQVDGDDIVYRKKFDEKHGGKRESSDKWAGLKNPFSRDKSDDITKKDSQKVDQKKEKNTPSWRPFNKSEKKDVPVKQDKKKRGTTAVGKDNRRNSGPRGNDKKEDTRGSPNNQGAQKPDADGDSKVSFFKWPKRKDKEGSNPSEENKSTNDKGSSFSLFPRKQMDKMDNVAKDSNKKASQLKKRDKVEKTGSKASSVDKKSKNKPTDEKGSSFSLFPRKQMGAVDEGLADFENKASSLEKHDRLESIGDREDAVSKKSKQKENSQPSSNYRSFGGKATVDTGKGQSHKDAKGSDSPKSDKNNTGTAWFSQDMKRQPTKSISAENEVESADDLPNPSNDKAPKDTQDEFASKDRMKEEGEPKSAKGRSIPSWRARKLRQQRQKKESRRIEGNGVPTPTQEVPNTRSGNTTKNMRSTSGRNETATVPGTRLVIMRPDGYPGVTMLPGPDQRHMISQRPVLNPHQALIAASIASFGTMILRLWIVVWITRKLASDGELISPRQHFVWECLNDRYVRDTDILARTLERPSNGFSKRQWRKYLKNINKARPLKVKAVAPDKTVIVIDVKGETHLDVAHITETVSFLVRVHSKRAFGFDPEVVLLVRSPGGEVTTFGLAAAQIARLQKAGLTVTVCVDNIAASGGYMMASQADRLLAAPFAMVGSIGVFKEGLNFNKLLKDYGINPIVIKAGERKNSLSALGPLSDKDIQEETLKMKEVHRDFIELCLARRPMLDEVICDGSVHTGRRALSYGLIDRILTSEEYIWEKICDGNLVLKMHKSVRENDRTRLFVRALDVLPHLRERASRMNVSLWTKQFVQGAILCRMAWQLLTKM